MLQAARRIADGQWPYRDFWWNYGPGQPVVLAALTKLFGPSLAAWRVLRVALDAVVALLAYRLARREATEPLALAAGLATGAAMAFPTGPSPNPAALAAALGAILLAGRPGGARPGAAGALAGLAAVFRPEIGVAAALGVLLATAPGARLRAALAAAAVAVAGWLPFVVAAPGDVLDDTVGFLGVQDLQRLPFPLDPAGIGLDANKLLELWMPLILVVGVAVFAAGALARRPSRTALALVPLVVVGLAYLLGRTDEFHLVPLAVVLSVVLVAPAPRAVRVAGLAVVALIAVHGVERKAGQLAHRPALERVPGPAGDGVRTEARDAADLRALLAAVGGRTMFVAPPRFDQVTAGDPLLYVIAGKDNPTRYDVVQPGVVTTEETQREMIEDLRRARPQVLVRWRDPRTAPEDNGSGRSSGVRLLDDELRRRYRPVARFGAYELLVAGTT